MEARLVGDALFMYAVNDVKADEELTVSYDQVRIVANSLDTKLNKVGIVRLEEAIQSSGSDLGKDPFPLIHHFAPGIYAREMKMPAGHVLTGKIHNHAHLTMISYGTVTISNEEGSFTVDAPHTFVSAPGTKRAMYSHTDVVLTTIHASNETDLGKLEEELTSDSYEEFEMNYLEKL